MESFDIPTKIPLLLLQNQVLLPGMTLRMESTNKFIIELMLKKDMELPLIVGIVPTSENSKKPSEGSVATAASINQILSVSVPRRTITLICVGLTRIRLHEVTKEDNNYFASVSVIEDRIDPAKLDEIEKLLLHLKTILSKLFSSFSSNNWTQLRIDKAFNAISKTELVDLCAAFASTSFEEKLEILQTEEFSNRLKKVISIAQRFEKEIGNPMAIITRRRLPMDRGLPTIRVLDKINPIKPDDDSKDITELKEKLEKAKLPPHAQKVASRELARLEKMSLYNPEHSVIRNYLDLIADLPWSISSSKEVDVNEAKEELDRDHYGLVKLKRRVIEYLAVSKLNDNQLRGPILCFVGPPGVGKTSVGRSIASILGRQFQRISLGGITNQSDIRGHRRTYIGSMPGRIIQAIKMAGTNNPVILLDEVDKMSSGIQGIPSAALLEVLDPEQNNTFVDHYLNIPFDLSKTVFIATANTTRSIPSPLLDRMEIIKVSGYTQEEKFEIAKNYLLPKQIKMHGLKPDMLLVPDETIVLLIKGYTKEAGVRAIERKLAAVCRAVAVKVVNPNTKPSELPVVIDADKVIDILGGSVYLEEDILSRTGVAGVAVGLAYNPVGGSVLMVEATLLPTAAGITAEILPQPNLVLTGQLGEVMRESAQLALNWLRSVAHKYGLVEPGQDLLKHNGVHIHFPSGAISKEGPSAGVTIAVALISLFTGLAVDKSMAFTGEITLQGIVLPVGGIREKILAASRAGITKIVLPQKCINYIDEIPKDILNSLELIYVNRMAEVIEAAFCGQITEISTLDDVKCKL
ncbi:hypothetical protein O3M35_003606 [Rhynocoris fuscipes]|uniref:Lon protease homolog n=1 Tax=Rhynocoris fuscipes TaxID=488301 RepID=A0AAW1CKZ1_9HEMI